MVHFPTRLQLLGHKHLHVFRLLPSATVFSCYYKPADPCHADALCASKRTIAALDHLREGESILPLPQPASISVAEITLRDLVVTTQDVDCVQHFSRKQDRKSEMVGCGRYHQKRSIQG